MRCKHGGEQVILWAAFNIEINELRSPEGWNGNLHFNSSEFGPELLHGDLRVGER